MRATETEDWRPASGVFTAPTCSSMTLPPGTGIRVGEGMSSGTDPTLDPRKRVWKCDNPAGHPAGLSESVSGCVLLSHTVTSAVPSALKGLASGFGMEPGVSPSL